MSFLSFLLFFFVSGQIALGYTVVLTTGKTIEGSLVSVEASTIVIRDSTGILLSFEKSRLDLEKMSLLNRSSDAEVRGVVKREAAKQPRLAEIASQTRKMRTGKARQVTLEDLQNDAPVSVLGSEDNREPATPKRAGEARTPDRDWAAVLWPVKNEVSRLREKRVEADAACERSKQKQYAARTTPSQKPVELLSTYKETPACRKLAEIDSQLKDAETRLENIREEGRRAGVSWQTLE